MIPDPLVLKVLREPKAIISMDLADWDLLLRQARSSNLLARIHSLIIEQDLIDYVPLEPREHLEWTSVIAERQIKAVHWEVAMIRKALIKTGPVILLKGAAYVIAKLPPAHGRLFSDIDIMVPKDSINEVEAALMLHGWATTHHDAYDQRYYRRWMHELPPMRHIKRSSVIDVHHAILPETAAVHPSPEKLRISACLLEGYDDLKIFSPADMVLHSATHLFNESELNNGLRDLVDIDSLLRHFDNLPSFWNILVERAKELELTRALFYSLRYAKLILHTPVPPSTLDAIKTGCPNQLVLMLMDSLFTRALLPDHLSCSDWLTKTAKRCLYIRGNWLRMPPLMLARHLLHKALISPKAE